MKPAFRPRAEPLPARAVVGGKALARRMLARPDAELHRLQVVVSGGRLVALAPAELLAWADGATYLGSDPRAPELLMPTTQEPDVHPQLLERALRRLKGAEEGPLAVIAGEVIPLGLAAPPSRERLTAWVNG